MHRTWARVGFSRGPWSGKEPNRTDKGATGANKVRYMALFPSAGGSKKWYFNEKCDGLTCKNVLPAEGRKHFFKKVSRNCKKELLRACGADERERIAHAIHKLKVPVHAFVFAIWLLEAKNAQSGESGFLKRPIERKSRTERKKER